MPRRYAWVFAKSAMAVCGASGLTAAGLLYVKDRQIESSLQERFFKVAHAADLSTLNVRPTTPLPSRAEILKALQEDEFDVVIIGGGATGAGTALDAQTRGLKTALIEYDDFASGTSSRSTKLVHGGVRYLQAAIMKADFEQYRMVKEALFERANLLQVAPHLASPLPIMLPVYQWWKVPYYWFGIKAYDIVSGKKILKKSYYISRQKALELFPMLKKDSLVGALIYYDGQQNDARMNLALAVSAVRHGAKCTNHCEVVDLMKKQGKDGKPELCGVVAKDLMTGKTFPVKAKCVINATGPFTDSIRLMDNPKLQRICVPAQGVHIVLPGYYSPSGTGLLDPQTSDGRVIFFLPWEKATVAGTTDSAAETTFSPAPDEKDVEFILEEVKHYLSPDITVRRGDVLSAWAGLRPLVRDPRKSDTKSVARNHVIEVSESNLITIAGGKWTTYRSMAEETVDKAVSICGLKPARACVTAGLLVEGAHNYHPLLYIRLVQDFGLEVEVAQHLAHNYGDRSLSVAKLAKLTGKRWPIVGKRLHEEFPYLEAEVLYALKEYALTAVDVIGRRLRLSFLNTHAAEEALPRIIEIMAQELKWDAAEKKKQTALAQRFLDVEMGKLARQRFLEELPIDLTKAERDQAVQRFNSLDKDKKGFITINDFRQYFKEKGEKIDERLLHDILTEVDLNKNGEVDLMEYLQVISGLKHGQITHSRFAKYLDESKASTALTSNMPERW